MTGSINMIPASEARKQRYAFVVLPSPIEEGGFNIVFPDLPGISSWSPTLEEIPDNVREVLDMEFDGSEEDGWMVPAPSAYPEDDMIRWRQPQPPAEPNLTLLYTAQAAGEELSITAQAVNLVARKHDLGRIIGGQRLFTETEVEMMKARPRPGKRRKQLV